MPRIRTRSGGVSQRTFDKVVADLIALRDKYDTAVKIENSLTDNLHGATVRADRNAKQITFLEQQIKRAQAHIIVLSGDRDRLTAMVESLARRLASPSADHDPNRGGWRGANYTDSRQATDPASEARKSSYGGHKG